jgi:hypothetical protein
LTASGAEQTVQNSQELRAAVGRARPGDVILLAPGSYSGGLYFAGVSGTQEQPIIVRGQDADNPPVFSGGGGQAMHLADCNWVTLANITVGGYPANGINIDDGGSFDTPAVGIVLDSVIILETGPRGNHDALKMSGVDRFVIRNCRFDGWGGSGIDMVGCHDGIVAGCTFVGREGFEQANAVQLKGGSRAVLVERCLFRNAGQRAINCGGSTGLAYFRPNVGDYEAKDIIIADNRFVGGMTPLAWVTTDGGWFHHNTIILPEKWVARILQETQDQRFKPSHGGIFEDNIIVYDSRLPVFVNVGPGAAPETFLFRRNAWCPVGDARKPSLPTPETDGLYGLTVTEGQIDREKGDVLLNDVRLKTKGARAYRAPDAGSSPRIKAVNS